MSEIYVIKNSVGYNVNVGMHSIHESCKSNKFISLRHWFNKFPKLIIFIKPAELISNDFMPW